MNDYSEYTPLPQQHEDTVTAACISVTICRIFEMRGKTVVDSSPALGLNYHIESTPSTNPCIADDSLWMNYTVNGVHVGNRNGCVRVVLHMLLEWQRNHVLNNQPTPKDYYQIRALVEKRIDALWPVISEDGDRSKYHTQYLERVGAVDYEYDTSQLRHDHTMHLAAIHHMTMLLDELTHLAHVRAKYPQHSFETISELASYNNGR